MESGEMYPHFVGIYLFTYLPSYKYLITLPFAFSQFYVSITQSLTF